MSASSSSSPDGRRGRRLRLLAACVALLGVAGYVLTQYFTGGTGLPRCTVRASDGNAADGPSEYEVDPEQAANAATIEAVASSRELPDVAVVIALATAMQESSLRNLNHGDRDSLGLFQQRPSQGWGTAQQVRDPVYAAGKFYDHLLDIPGYAKLPLTVAAQKVQRSGYPRAYAKHEGNATLLGRALTGRPGAVLNCTTGPGDMVDVGDITTVRKALAREFGPDVLDGRSADAPRGTERTGNHHAGSVRARGAARVEIELPVRSDRRGRELSHWAVAHAAELHIARVTDGDRVWSADRSAEGWRAADKTEGATSTVVLRLAGGS